MLSFEVTREGRTIEIHCDQEGLEVLIGKLKGIRNTATHIHLRAPHVLSEKTPWGKDAVPEVVISTGGD